MGTISNPGFIGTTTGAPLDFFVNNEPGLRIETTASTPNLIGGYTGNTIGGGSLGAIIAGGGVIGENNTIGDSSAFSAIGGGKGNHIAASSWNSTIGGGLGNEISIDSDWSTIGGGQDNLIESNSFVATIGGGSENVIAEDADYSTVAGGSYNWIEAGAEYAAICGGQLNSIGTNSSFSTIGGGYNNQIGNDAEYAATPGGYLNEVGATASYALAAGTRAKANHTGAFVWADSQNADFASTSSNQFLIRASGGVGIGTGNPGNPFTVVAADGTANGGVAGFNEVIARVRRTGAGHAAMAIDAPSGRDAILYLAENGSARWALRHDASEANELDIRFDGQQVFQLKTNGDLFLSGTVNPPSDRNLKQAFSPVDPAQVLERVTALPIQTWVYKNAPQTRHLGPVAQDFHAAFGLGVNDVTIATVDADGVALAAIQGLNQKLTDELKRRDAENAELKQRLGALEKLMTRVAMSQNPASPQN